MTNWLKNLLNPTRLVGMPRTSLRTFETGSVQPNSDGVLTTRDCSTAIDGHDRGDSSPPDDDDVWVGLGYGEGAFGFDRANPEELHA